MASIEDELNQLEKDLRQLKIEYDTYFTGGRPRPPADTEWRVQTLIKKFADMGGKMKFAQRFRYNGLASRYAKYSEVWRQRAKRVEMGGSAFAYSKVGRELEQQRLAEAERKHAARIGGNARVAFSDPLKEGEKVQELYRTMLEAKEKAGEKADVNFEQFHQFVRNKTDQLKKQMGCKAVEYEVSVEGGQVKLKAKGV
ncbi:MAG: MXAN_5187 C-terminal domain-containing protein [Candidatus Acidiferrales bacterium]